MLGLYSRPMRDIMASIAAGASEDRRGAALCICLDRKGSMIRAM